MCIEYLFAGSDVKNRHVIDDYIIILIVLERTTCCCWIHNENIFLQKLSMADNNVDFYFNYGYRVYEFSNFIPNPCFEKS